MICPRVAAETAYVACPDNEAKEKLDQGIRLLDGKNGGACPTTAICLGACVKGMYSMLGTLLPEVTGLVLDLVRQHAPGVGTFSTLKKTLMQAAAATAAATAPSMPERS